MNSLNIIKLSGPAARAYVNELADLRLKVFFDYPYLYEGTLEYEKNYLETYFKAENAFILLVKDHEKIVGATTSILASEEEASFRKPFEDFGLDVSKVFYFGESVLLPEYRGIGMGKIFFQEREAYARSLGFITTLSFCGVVREENHLLKPPGYKPLDEFWKSQGFVKESKLVTSYEWMDRGDSHPTSKKMQFWIKNI